MEVDWVRIGTLQAVDISGDLLGRLSPGCVCSR